MKTKMMILVCLLAGILLSAAEQTAWTKKQMDFTVQCTTNCPDAIGKLNTTVKIAVTVKGTRKGFFSARFYHNGREIGQKMYVPVGQTAEFSASLVNPGVLYVRYTISDADKKHILGKNRQVLQGGLGVLVAPEALKPGNPLPPADFDVFWQKKRKELDQVPVKAAERPLALPRGFDNIRCADVTVDCTGGTPVTGVLTMPKNAAKKSLPAVVYFNGAGVYSAFPHPYIAQKAIAFDVNAHGILNGQNAKYYQDLNSGKLKNYRSTLTGDPGKDYFTGMLVRVMRALDYVKTIPEWNGRDLYVRGRSQGGAQALAAAALDHDVTLCLAEVPALCDHGGRLVNRQPGWPRFLDSADVKKIDKAKLKEVSYFDIVFFAPKIKCPVYVTAGLIDNTCLSSGVYAMFNRIPRDTPKAITIMPDCDHADITPVSGRTEMERLLQK